jgi:hypothetical protein
VGEARTWVRERLSVESPGVKAAQLPLGQGLPLDRKQRQGHRWP